MEKGSVDTNLKNKKDLDACNVADVNSDEKTCCEPSLNSCNLDSNEANLDVLDCANSDETTPKDSGSSGGIFNIYKNVKISKKGLDVFILFLLFGLVLAVTLLAVL